MRVCDGISEGIARSLGHNGWGPCGLQVHAVLTVPVSVALIQPGPKGHHKRRLLVLVEQDGIAVLALALSLYEPLASESPPPGEQVTAYIDKLDSSGFLERAKDASVSLSRSVLEGLVEALLAIYSRLRLHVFARAQPQFLFPLSAKNPEKRILGERALVRWWAKTLGYLSLKNNHSNKTQGWLFVPGETELSVRDLQKDLNWTFGWPWPESTKATSVIPHFSDDAKTKGLALLGPSGSIKDLSEILSLTGECGSGRFSAFFVLDLSALMDVEHSSSPKVAKDSLTKESSVSLEDLEALENTMLSTEFDTKEHASEATRKIRERLLKMAVVGQPVVAPKESDSLVRSPGTLQKKPATPLVNTIHSVSVKRVPPQITNNIWHLVKKKKTA